MKTPVEELDALESLYNQGLISVKDFEAQKKTILKKIDGLMGYEAVQEVHEPRGFWATYFHVWMKCFNFSTRTNRTEYFLFNLVNSCFLTVYSFIYRYLQLNIFLRHSAISHSPQTQLMFLNILTYIQSGLALITMLISWIIVGQRLRDTGRSALVVLLELGAAFLGGYFLYIQLFPVAFLFFVVVVVLALYIFVVSFFRGTLGKNRYGFAPTPSKTYVSYLLIVVIILNIAIVIANEVNTGIWFKTFLLAMTHQ